jgi:hypothetical protein
MGLTTLPCKKKIVEKPPRNSTGFCVGCQGLGWAVEPRKEEEEGCVMCNVLERAYIIYVIVQLIAVEVVLSLCLSTMP